MKKRLLCLMFVFIFQIYLIAAQGAASDVSQNRIKADFFSINQNLIGDDNKSADSINSANEATDDMIGKEMQSLASSVIICYKNPDTGLLTAASGNKTEFDFMLSKKRLIDVKPIIKQYKSSRPAMQSMSDEAILDEAYQKMSRSQQKLLNTYVLKIKKDFPLHTALEKLRQANNVEYAEPNYIYTTCAVPQDELYPKQWAHQNTQAEMGWDITKGSPEIVVAVIDSGVSYQHEDLKANIWRSSEGHPGKDFVDIDPAEYTSQGYLLVPEEDYTEIDNDPADFDGHGTHCSGIIAGSENGVGIVGVGPRLKIMPVRAGFSLKVNIPAPAPEIYRGFLEGDDIINAIYWAVDNGAHVISMSFGAKAESQAMKDALDYAYQKGVVPVAAAGNSNIPVSPYPAGFETVIAVGATMQQDQKAGFSNFGKWVDVSAPGRDILSTVPSIGPSQDPSGYKSMSGTSMACPYVAGLAGLILSKNNQLSPAEVKAILKSSTDPIQKDNFKGYFPYIGTGRVNVKKALDLNLEPGAEIPAAQITAPFHTEFIAADKIDIIGSASGESYQLEYTDDPYSQDWTLISSGTSVKDGLLGSLPINPQTIKGTVYFRVTSQSGNLIDISLIRAFILDKYPGWPKKLNGETYGTPVVIDVDGDGLKEVIAANYFNHYDSGTSNLYLFNHDGSLRWVKTFDRKIYVNPVAGDIDNDGLAEIFIYKAQKLFAFKADGTEMAGNWPLPMPVYRILNISLSDINNDGFLEVIFSAQVIIDKKLEVFIYNHDGTPLPGWPVELEAGLFGSAAAVADLDLDGYEEIIFGSFQVDFFPDSFRETKLYVYRYTGEIFSGNWPVLIRGQMLAAPAIGDVNNDGQYEIVAKSSGSMTVLDLEGKPISDQWPYEFDDTYWFPPFMSPVLADLDHDKDLEILFNISMGVDPKRWQCYHHDGSKDALWDPQLELEPGFVDDNFNPAVADLDNDGNMEVLDLNNISLTVLSHTGELKQSLSHPLTLYNFERLAYTPRSPMITDLDNDGKIEVVCTNKEDDLFVFHYEGSYEEDSIEWQGWGNGTQKTFTRPIRYTADIEFTDWGTGCEENIIITNRSKTDLNGWRLEFDWDREITNIWGAKIVSYEDNHYTLVNETWNSQIKPGEKIKLGFIAKPGHVTQKPVNYRLNDWGVQTQCIAPPVYSFTVDSHITSLEDNFKGEITVTNTGNKKVVGWQVEFDFDQLITSIWNGKIIKHEDNHYVISNLDWNAVINPGETVSFGLIGHQSGIFEEPENFKINNYTLP